MMQDEAEKLDAGRAIDVLIAVDVMGAHDAREHVYSSGEKQWIMDEHFRPLPRYSTDISAALEVAEKFDNFSIARAWKLNIGSEDWRGYSAWLALGPEAVSALAETIPLAICRAALMLKG